MTVYKASSVPVINQLISHLPDDWGIYIHIDKKSDINPSCIDARAHVCSIYKIYWGSKEHLDAELALFKQAYESTVGFDYFHLVSGEDYWCCPPCNFDTVFTPPYSYMYSHPLPWSGWYNGGFELIQYKQLASYGDIRKGLMAWLNRIVKWSQIVLGIRQKLPDYPLYCNVARSSLHRTAVHEILFSSIADDLNKRMENTLIPEELFFSTVLLNSPVKNQIVPNSKRYVDWSSVPAPKVLTTDDLGQALASGAVFCRKVANLEIALEIDRRLGLSPLL